jgi:hypothetical protein
LDDGGLCLEGSGVVIDHGIGGIEEAAKGNPSAPAVEEGSGSGGSFG